MGRQCFNYWSSEDMCGGITVLAHMLCDCSILDATGRVGLLEFCEDLKCWQLHTAVGNPLNLATFLQS